MILRKGGLMAYLKQTLYLLTILLCFSPGVLTAGEIKVGDVAPAFTTIDDQGRTISLKDFLGKTVILYFYPKDDTPGCTIEAKSFRDTFDRLQKKNVVVIGVSYDDQASHQAFKATYNLPFILAVDQDKAISKAYGVDGLFFADRTTFVIDPAGKIKFIYPNVNPSNHAEEILLML